MKMIRCNLFIAPKSVIIRGKRSTLRCRKYHYNGTCDFSFNEGDMPGSCSFSRDLGASFLDIKK